MNNAYCPPHHWWIESATETEIGEERWTCQRCGTVKFPRRVAQQRDFGELGLSNLSTVNREDVLISGWKDA